MQTMKHRYPSIVANPMCIQQVSSWPSPSINRRNALACLAALGEPSAMARAASRAVWRSAVGMKSRTDIPATFSSDTLSRLAQLSLTAIN